MTPSSTARALPAPAKQNFIARFKQRAFRTAPRDRNPVVLRHSRIYIIPTRRGLAFLGTVVMMLITSLNYALSLAFGVTFLLSGLAAAALLHTFRNFSGLSLQPLSAGEAFAGNPLPFTLSVDSGEGARHAISIAAAGSTVKTIDVPAASVIPITLEMPTSRRGALSLGRVTLSSDFPLGLWKAWAYVHFPLTGIVFPMPEAGAPPLPSGSADGHDNSMRLAADGELAGLRDYVVGDPMQRVAWKAVARGAGWHTKTFEGMGGGGPVDLIWHALPAALDVETKLARLCAWVLAAERVARAFSLSLPGVALPAGQGRKQRRAALEALALHDVRKQ
jgi:uncharacterized protein (DUF58 family)